MTDEVTVSGSDFLNDVLELVRGQMAAPTPQGSTPAQAGYVGLFVIGLDDEQKEAVKDDLRARGYRYARFQSDVLIIPRP